MRKKRKLLFQTKLYSYWIHTSYTVPGCYIPDKGIISLRLLANYLVQTTFLHVLVLSMASPEKKNLISFTQILLSQSEIKTSSVVTEIASFAKIHPNPFLFEHIFLIFLLLSFCLQNFQDVTLVIYRDVVNAFKKFFLFFLRKLILRLKEKEKIFS